MRQPEADIRPHSHTGVHAPPRRGLRLFALTSLIAGLGLAGGLYFFSGSGPSFAQSFFRDSGLAGMTGKTQLLSIQVDENKPEIMNLALNNAKNVVEHFKSKGQKVDVEIVTFGPGLHMLRSDTSPVKQRIAQMSLEEPSIKFAACANTQANMSKQEQKKIELISEAQVVPSGVVRLMELQGKGYAYVRP